MSQNSKFNGTHLLLILTGIGLAAYLATSLQSQHLTKPISSSSKKQQVAEQAYVNVDVPPLSDYIETTERPLFSRSRRPVVRAAQPINKFAVKQSPTPPKRVPLLVGIVASGGIKTALIRSNKTGELQRIKEQESVDGWLMMEISQQTVVLVSPSGNKQTLDLRDNRSSTTFKRQSSRRPAQVNSVSEEQRKRLEMMKRTARSNRVLKAEIKNVVKQKVE